MLDHECISTAFTCFVHCACPILMLQWLVTCLQLDLERKLRALLTKEKDKAEEQAALSMGLCTGAFTLP